MRKLVVICCLVVLSVVYATPAAACSGWSEFFVQDFEYMDLIVHAKVLEADDRGFNAVLQVDSYFKGVGSEYLAVERYPAALQTTKTARDYDTSCLYSGGGEQWIAGSEGYFALDNNENGTYTDGASNYSGTPHFYEESGQVEFYDYEDFKNEQYERRSLPVAKFESVLLQYGGKEKPIEPVPNAYPLKRFLTITTESGKRYQLNPDRSVTWLDPETSPLAVSNDGSHVVFSMDDSQIGFQYLWLTKPDENRIDYAPLTAQAGIAGEFSPDSNFVAVQEAKNITVYLFDNYERGGYGQRMTMRVIGGKSADWLASGDDFPLVWSADSSTIAYQDTEGIWIWDIFESAEPQLVVKQSDGLRLLDISNSGRYVRYQQGDQWLLLEVPTGELFENAIATPNESNLIYVQQEYPEGTPDVNRKGETSRECQAPLSQSCPIYLTTWQKTFSYFWYNNNQIAIVSCDSENCYVVITPIDLAIGNVKYQSYTERIIGLFDALDYDITYGKPAVAVNGYTLQFGFYADWFRDDDRLDSVDLSGALDSPIVKLEWGLPLFYEVPQG